ncbi:MAG TPA: pyridoxamine kinase [Candidatus Ligilactobacillus excrementipullorum]|nr:pyridoxamine kinase [Candidatus Ligilactobacillus excrementipullorum]
MPKTHHARKPVNAHLLNASLRSVFERRIYLSQNILVSQDLSCFGQVSLLTALPLLSASGLNVTALPTALLSTHTGGFGQNTYLDLSHEMGQIINHWHELNLTFSAVYLGYLGQQPLRQLLARLPKITDPDSMILLDPVMGDHGKLYQGFDQSYVTDMRALLPQAHVLTPNLTEAAFLLGQPELSHGGLVAAKLAVKELHDQFQVPVVLVTGVPVNEQEIAVVGQTKEQPLWTEIRPRIAANYFGTGDIFAAALFAGLLHGLSAQKASIAAMDLLSHAITVRQSEPEIDPRLGINYSQALPQFLQQINKGAHFNER